MTEQELAKAIKGLVIKTLENSTVTLNLSQKFLEDLQKKLQQYEDSNKPKDVAPKINKVTAFGGKTKRKYRHKKRTLRH